MVFSSQLFLFWFLPATLLLYWAAPRRFRHAVLTLASYAFYGWANPWFVLLMLGSTLVDFVCGLAIMRRGPEPNPNLDALAVGGRRSRAQRVALTISIVSNLSLLGFFKYFNFGLENWNALATSVGLDGAVWDAAFRVTLPLGISFYTFQSMSYSIDVFRGHARGMANFVDFACYVSMFPQLVAGPIIRFSEVADQLRDRSHTWDKAARGVALLSLGLAKKVLLANPCGKVADLCFGADVVGVGDAWYGAVAYAMQIYFDFSGYSDMAIGLGLLLGFTFPKNFESPYRSRSITEFWRRWHISLSSWLRDYLYVPLGGNRRGRARTYVNLAAVMLLGGLWHGASWNFVIWGGIHGVWLAVERAIGKDSLYRDLPTVVRVALTFGIVLVAWVFFRAVDLDAALRYLGCMFGVVEVPPAADVVGAIVRAPYYAGCVVVAVVTAFFGTTSWDWTAKLSATRASVCFVAFVLAAVVLSTQAFNPFIYFIF